MFYIANSSQNRFGSGQGQNRNQFGTVPRQNQNQLGTERGQNVDDEDVPETNEQTEGLGSCGGQLTGDVINIYSPNFPERYPGNADCLWTINLGEGNRIARVTFAKFDTQRFVDVVQIVQNNRIIRSYSGTGNPVPVQISGNQLQIRFRSNAFNNRFGFHIIVENRETEQLRSVTSFPSTTGVTAPDSPRQGTSFRGGVRAVIAGQRFANSRLGPGAGNCVDGTFGDECEKLCHCRGGAVCDKISGRCPRGQCASRFSGDDCQTFECGRVDREWGFTDPSDCSKYFMCLVDPVVQCKFGHMWMDSGKVCAPPSMVTCDTDPRAEFTCDGKEPGAFYADPTDCSRYIVCTERYHMRCPAGLVWDEDLQRCEFSTDDNNACPDAPRV